MLPKKEQFNGGIVAAAVLAILLVALSTYGRRCRQPAAVRFFVWSASIVFLPLTSSIISSLLDRSKEPECDGTMPPPGKQNPDVQNMWTLLLWIVLILTIKCNADVAAASPDGGDVHINGQRIRAPVELVAQYAWAGFLIRLCVPLAGRWLGRFNIAIFMAFSVLGLAKLVSDDGKDVPRYIVTGEKKKHVEESARGYRVKLDVLDNDLSSLVKLDRVWSLAEHDGGILAEPQHKLRDLCLSYSLFKILRRRLLGYPLADAGSRESLDFVLRVISTTYSPIPLCALGGLWATLNYLCSILIIVGAIAVGFIYEVNDVVRTTPYNYKIITYSLLVAVVLIETWEIVAGVCSNWTKVALLGHYIRHESAWRRSSFVHAVLVAVLRLRPPMQWLWRHKMGQNSVLELESRQFLRRITGGLLPEKLYLYGGAGLMRPVEVTTGVKDAVLRSLLSSYGRMSKGGAAVRRVGGRINWAVYGTRRSWAWGDEDEGGSSNAELILTWHIGTALFEMMNSTTSTSAPEMEAARHLSCYCAYLVAAAPELLPDSDAWTIKRYKDVSDDVRAAALAAGGGRESPAARYERLVAALGVESRDRVLRRGAELGRHLVNEYARDEASAWRILLDFWSDMLLYLAPSEKVKGHVEAMARGGEFITLVWALLLHAGVITRPGTPAGDIP
ncbi:uncharacterized protein LOC8075309 [Sorghum bicolor]|uniref:uncharacterized protein LOC8075309 n=1 Tax=Sorghum bicolor TaxID=4558 RepID=UPI000B426037|nr:uncharacterized protein LOC8075309 [Sorghum bicolor]|eukprot:XP_021311822.1 uncharacterized protein LOC8075309 [Sorghum bicolor]